MRAAVTVGRLGTLLLALVAADGESRGVATQGPGPLGKSDLVRLLTGSTLSRPEIASLIARNCLRFTPTERDRADLRELGADSVILRRIDQCARRTLPPAATPPSPPSASPPLRPGPLVVVPAQARVAARVGTEVTVSVALRRGSRPAPGVPLVLRVGAPPLPLPGQERRGTTDEQGVVVFRVPTGPTTGVRTLTVVHAGGDRLEGRATIQLLVQPTPVVAISSARTGFVSGGGQRGRVGTRLPLPLVFEVRDSANLPVGGQTVTFLGTNARLTPGQGVTDSAGQVRVEVTLGPRVEPVAVTASVRGLERQVHLIALAGPAAAITVACGSQAVADRLVITPGATAELRVRVLDALGNALPVSGLRVAIGDDRVLRLVRVDTATAPPRITLHPGEAGATSVAVFGSGLRENLRVTVARSGGARCP